MRVAIPISAGRVSPVFDVAEHFVVIEFADGQEVDRHDEEVRNTQLGHRVDRVVSLEIDTLICGAISRPFEAMLITEGVEVISQICGEVEEVLEAFLSGTVTDQRFLMPGCCGRRRRFRGGGCSETQGERMLSGKGKRGQK